MGSTELRGRSGLARKNTFQRMLDLEQKNKVNRMQASQHVPQLVHTSTALGRESISSISNREFRPPTLQVTGRAMTTPALSIALPTPMSNTNGNGTTRKYVISQSGDLIPQELDDSEDDSDTSSICHSPGWDDLSGKKKKQEKKAKEQRRREREKAEKEAKAAQKAMAKLTKAAPANSSKKLSRMSITIDRSNTAPILPTVQDVQPPVEEPSPSRQSTTTRPRRGSIEAGLKSFISTRSGISVPWKTSQNMSGQSPNHEFIPSRSISKATTGGFIGGLKLRQSEEAATQDIIRRLKTGAGDENKGLLSTDTLLKSSTNLSSAASITESIRPISIYEESIRTPQQWDEIYSQAAHLARGPRPVELADDTPIMERNIKKNRKKHPPTSRYFPLESEDSNSSKRESSTASTRTSAHSGAPSSDDRNGQGQTSSAERPATGGHNSSLGETRGRSDSYVGHQRKQSREQSLAGFQDEVQLSDTNGDSKRPGSSKSSFFRRSSLPRESNREAPSTIRPGTRDSSVDTHVKEAVITNPFLNEEYVVPQLHLGEFTASPLDEKPVNHKKTSSKSSQSFPGPKGLKVTTKPTFFKLPTENLEEKSQVVPPSPTGSFVSAVETQATLRPKASQRALTTGTIVKSSTKPKHIVEEYRPPTIVHDFAVRSKSPPSASPDTIRARPSSRKGSQNATPITSNSNSSTTSHTRSITDSSEEYSTLDDFSNITTPSISRPHSEKDYSRSMDELNRKTNTKLMKRLSREQGVIHNGLNGHPVMTGAIPFDDGASQRDSWCRTAMPMDSSEGEDRMKTPTGKKRSTDFVVSKPESTLPKVSDGPPPKTSDGLSNSNCSGIQRRPSLARSISTPDLQQDLSFLPPLKHQALTKPQKKSRGFLGRRTKESKQASVSSDTEKSPTSLVRPPPPITLSKDSNTTVTKSEGSSPTSPQPPSQYLQNARLNIGGPRSPKFPHSGNPHLSSNNNNAEPVAKMFVVCCSCKYFHDMPSKIYECMAKPDNVVTDTKLGVSGVISTSVKCPWCGHGMSTSCCAGYAAVVYLREKFH
ncbi:uncharacterized protein LY89DRAFT_328852 [Mollisia scopiformis]|uniref:Uncharacterized protein n=1 Tax=Mollisia scopiformis TaxID=149040 RepID=A0A132B927_MOLSC|nr:uncharacterized protein LY89DRAFT_328852 [Mollisia scopiformis]KUJ08905.1 hypothetical protein LY89DRAFT_328852 [Mollisia scopiformis]